MTREEWKARRSEILRDIILSCLFPHHGLIWRCKGCGHSGGPSKMDIPHSSVCAVKIRLKQHLKALDLVTPAEKKYPILKPNNKIPVGF